MCQSDLVSVTRLSPNCTRPRKGKIDAIVIHHAAGSGTVEALGALFADPARQASANYGVGSDGRIACYVAEENRAWTTGNAIDHRAITLEVANCGGAPNWPVSDEALEATIALCTDVCRRYGFKLNYTGDKGGNLHMHRWYANTACPGPYLMGKFAYIAGEVNKRLEDRTASPEETVKNEEGYTLDMRILKQGDSGEAVRALQILLKGNGCDLGTFGPQKDGIDGQYGAATATAVRKLQTKRALAVDGIAGPQVMGSLLGV